MALLPQNESRELKTLTRSYWTGLEKIPLEDISILPKGDNPAPDKILPVLARMFDVDITGLPDIASQRNTINLALRTHRHRGTRWAVEKAIQAVYGTAKVEEWFEYGGNPGTFKVTIDVDRQPLDSQAIDLIAKLIETHKNVRSWVDTIQVYLTSRGSAWIAPAFISADTIKVYPQSR